MSRMAFRTLAAALLLTTCSPAYYYFTHFTRNGRPVYERFDPGSLPNRTLNYFVEDGSRLQLSPGDSYLSLLSQIRSAAKVWNDVDTSDLRIAFAGIAPRGQTGGPAMEILFDEVPPGIVAYGGPTVRAENNGAFIPILRSVVVINADLTKRPSYMEAVHGTLVHEIGHALGLQHTLTSSAMSTASTRATSKARPLAADDIAAISVLYPRGNYLAATGSVSGRVVFGNGTGVNLASVVAISPSGPAISTLTNPDGSYRIDGLPPRPYVVYVHPLPPAREGQATPADIVYPQDADGRPLPASSPFETAFYGLTGSVRDATPVTAAPGTPVENVNFIVRQRTGYAAHSVETWAFPASFAVRPAILYPGSRPFIVATGSGIIGSNGPLVGPPTVLGGGTLSVQPYPQAPASYLQIDVPPSQQPAQEPRHLVFPSGNDTYVLPFAFFQSDRGAPQVVSVNAAPEAGPRGAVIFATNVTANTRILFDGVDAIVRTVAVEDQAQGLFRVTVTAPAAAPGHRASVVAMNPDGQSSLFVASEAPAFAYPADPAPAVALAASPNSLPSGVETTLQIDGLNTQFAEGQVSVGFGTADVAVRRIWVVSPTRMLVSVATAPGLQAGVLNLTVATGLHIVTSPSLIAAGPPARPFWLSLPATASVSAGSPVTMTAVSPVPLTAANTAVFINEIRAAGVSVNGSQITFTVPAAIAPGPALIRVEANGERSLTTAINIEVPLLRILSGVSGTNVGVPVVLMDVQNLGDKPVSATLNGKNAKVAQVWRDGDKYKVLIELSEIIPPGVRVTVVLSSDGRTSDPFSLTIGG